MATKKKITETKRFLKAVKFWDKKVEPLKKAARDSERITEKDLQKRLR